MKILQLIPNLSGGGAERFVVDLSNELVKDHEVALLTLYDLNESDLFRKELDPKIQTLSLGKKRGFDWKVVPHLYKTIKNLAPNIIHNHLRTLNYLIPLIPVFRKIPVVHTIHSDALFECPNPKIRKVRKIFFKCGKVIPVTISKESATSFEKAYGSVPHRIIYNGRTFPKRSTQFKDALKEIEGYKKNEDTQTFIHIGRQVHVKNQMMLITAFRKLIIEEKVNAVLLMIGGGRNTEESQKIQRALQRAEKETEQIHIIGEKANATDYLNAADYFCLSSLHEGMPITLIEALATGTIPICTPVGGVTEMVQELDASLLSEEVSVDSYYKTLKRAYELPGGKQGQLKKKAQALFKEKYAMETCASQYLKLYKSLIK